MTNNIYPDVAIVEQVHFLTTSNQAKLVGFAFPTKGEEGGYFSKSYNTSLVANNIRQLILTEKGERVMQPDFGIRLRSRLFQPLDSVLTQGLSSDIRTALATYLPIVQIVSLTVEEDTRHSAGDLGRLIIRLAFSLKNFPFEVEEVFIRA